MNKFNKIAKMLVQNVPQKLKMFPKQRLWCLRLLETLLPPYTATLQHLLTLHQSNLHSTSQLLPGLLETLLQWTDVMIWNSLVLVNMEGTKTSVYTVLHKSPISQCCLKYEIQGVFFTSPRTNSKIREKKLEYGIS